MNAVDSMERSTSGTVVATGVKAKCYGFILIPDGSNAGTVILESGGSGGTARLRGRVLATVSEAVILSHPITFNDGIYATLSGTGIIVEVLYRALP